MIITRAPFRMSFFGGGSDLPSFYSKSEGAVLSAAINKYMYISTHKYFEKDRFQLKYSQTESVTDLNLIKHKLLRTLLKTYTPNVGIELNSVADIPAGTGLGSSSAFAVAVIHNLMVRAGKYCTKKQLAEMACDIEINQLKEPIGKQDQYASAFGGLNIFRFQSNGDVFDKSLVLADDVRKNFRNHLMMFYTKMTRPAAEVLTEQKSNIEKNESKVTSLKQMVELVFKGEIALQNSDFEKFGHLLHESWELKRTLASKISSADLDDMYKKALKAGAFGGKLLGAGGGGFLLFVCPPSKQENLRSALSNLDEISFQFDLEGAKAIYFGDEDGS